jgi:soluble lytic murein transglycosylase-like protein
MKRRWQFAIWFLLMLAAVPCFAGEVAVLKNGFSIRHERRVVIGEMTRLYVNADGSSYVDVRTDDIEHFEAAAPELAPASVSPAGLPRANVSPKTPAARVTSFPARPITDLSDVVNAASGRYRLDPDLVNSVIKAESGFNAHAISPKGARGLMQLMPGTASQLGVRNAFDPQANVEGGTKYLRELLERYNFDLVKALAAYNAGPERVEQFGGVPPFHETRAYVARIVKDFNKKKLSQKSAGTAKPAAHTAANPPKTHRPAASTQARASTTPSP